MSLLKYFTPDKYIDILTVNFTGWNRAENDLPAASLHDILKYHVCMRSSLTKEVLQLFADNASNPTESSQLKKLASNRRAYKVWKQDHLGVVDVLRKFPSIMVDSSAFLYLLKPLQPRYSDR